MSTLSMPMAGQSRHGATLQAAHALAPGKHGPEQPCNCRALPQQTKTVLELVNGGLLLMVQAGAGSPSCAP